MSSNNGTDTSQQLNVKKAISQSTLDCINMITDPYHDFNLRIEGIPDGKALATCVQRFYERTSIYCPFTLEDNDTWDFNVYTTGLHSKQRLFEFSYEPGNNLITQFAHQETLGPVTILYRKFNALGSLVATVWQCLGPPNTTDVGLDTNRIVSLGFELHNVSAELDKAGDLTVYRTNRYGSTYSGAATSAASGTNIYHYTTSIIAENPIDVQTASTMPNTRTWEAKEGAYCVALPEPSPDFCSPMSSNLMIINHSYASYGPLVSGWMYRAVFPGSTVSHNGFTPMYNVGVVSGRYSDAKQRFTLDYRMILETNPAAASPLISFSKNTNPYDRVFLKLYKAMINRIPPGVPVGQNDAGEWFRKIVSIANKVLPVVSPFLPGHLKTVAMLAQPIVAATQAHIDRKRLDQSHNVDRNGRMLPGKKQ